MRRNDVASTSFRRHVPTRFLINQCQIITFLILKYDIENSRIELRGIVLPVQVGGLLGGAKGYVGPPSQNIGGPGPCPPPPPPPPPLPTPMDLIENSRIELRGIVLPVQVGGLLGGAKGYVGPPLKILGGLAPLPPPPPLPTPMDLMSDSYLMATKPLPVYIFIRPATRP